MTTVLRLPTSLQVLVVALLLLFSGAVFLEWNLRLSPEAQQYQTDYPDMIRSGFDISYGGAKLLFLMGTIAGLLGCLLILLGRLSGFIPMAVAAPLLAVGAYINAPEATYPSVQPIYLSLLWCSTLRLGLALSLLLGRLRNRVFNTRVAF